MPEQSRASDSPNHLYRIGEKVSLLVSLRTIHTLFADGTAGKQINKPAAGLLVTSTSPNFVTDHEGQNTSAQAWVSEKLHVGGPRTTRCRSVYSS